MKNGRSVHWSSHEQFHSVLEQDAVFTHETTKHGICLLRSLVVKLQDDSLLIVGPDKQMKDDAHTDLKKFGKVTILLAPNHFHSLGLDEYAKRYSGAKVVATQVAAERLSKRISTKVHTLNEVTCDLPKGVSFLEPPGTRNGEIWLRIESNSGVRWCVCDAFLNVPRIPRSFAGAFMWMAGMVPGLRISSPFKWAALSNRSMYRDWLVDRITIDQPIAIIPSHGDVLECEAFAEQLLDIVERRLP